MNIDNDDDDEEEEYEEEVNLNDDQGSSKKAKPVEGSLSRPIRKVMAIFQSKNSMSFDHTDMPFQH